MTIKTNYETNMEHRLKQLLNGSYSDVMFMTVPFAGLLIHSIWVGSVIDFFTTPYLSILNAVLAGTAISKYIQCLAFNLVPPIGRPKVANKVAFITLFSFIPSLILAVNIHSTEEPAEFVTYIQFSIFILSISTYFFYFRFVSNLDYLKSQDEAITAANNFPEEVLNPESNE